MCHKEAGDWDWWAQFCTEGNQATTDCSSQLVRVSTVQRTNKTSGARLLPLTQLEGLTLILNAFGISHHKRRSVSFYFHIFAPLGISYTSWRLEARFRATSERLFHSLICCKWLIFHRQGSVCAEHRRWTFQKSQLMLITAALPRWHHHTEDLWNSSDQVMMCSNLVWFPLLLIISEY